MAWLIQILLVIASIDIYLAGELELTDLTPADQFYPYHIAFVADLHGEECLMFREEHICDDKRRFIIEFHNKDKDLWLKIRVLNNRGKERLFDRFVRREKSDCYSLEIMYHTVQAMREYQPAIQQSIVTDPGDNNDHLILEQCRRIKISNGNCEKRRICQFYTAHRHFNKREKQPDGWPKSENCVKDYKDPCLKGFCHESKRCIRTDYAEMCDCDRKGVFGLGGFWLGEYCSIRDEEDVAHFAKYSSMFSVEVDFEEGKLEAAFFSNFEGSVWKYLHASLYRLTYDHRGARQGRPVRKVREIIDGNAVFTFPVEPNSTYLLESVGSNIHGYWQGDDAMNWLIHRNSSFRQYMEVHTPGYTLLPPPTDLQITHNPSNHMFNLTWRYRSQIPATEFLIRLERDGGPVEQEVSERPWELLPLLSSTTYRITVTAVNSVGYSRPPAGPPLVYTTPFFTYNLTNHGRYDFARWFFQSSSISLSGRYVYFKNNIRRDVRIIRTVLMAEASETPDTDMSAIYHAARFDQTYQTAHLTGPYIVVSLTPTQRRALPRRVLLGDGTTYSGYLNGRLERGHTYQAYAIVWYRSGNDTAVSVSHLGELRRSTFPWMGFLIAVAVGASLLSVVSTLVNWLAHGIVIAVKKRRVRAMRGTSVQALLAEEVYEKDILPDPNYNLTESAANMPRVRSSFSNVVK